MPVQCLQQALGPCEVTFAAGINGSVWVERGDTAIGLRAGPTLVTGFMAPPSKLKHSCESNGLEGCASCDAERRTAASLLTDR